MPINAVYGPDSVNTMSTFYRSIGAVGGVTLRWYTRQILSHDVRLVR